MGYFCVICGQEFNPSLRDDRGRPRISKRKTCGDECKGALISQRRRGVITPTTQAILNARRQASRFVGDVPLSNGMHAVVDPEDFDRVMGHCWSPVPGTNGICYASAWIDGRPTKMHSFVMSAPPGQRIDHRNRDGLDNRKQNLREATASQNASNQRIRRDNKTGYRGVQTRRGKWRAVIRHNQRTINIGDYGTPEDAARAYDQRARELFGEFARLNFPESGEQSA